VIIDRYDTPAIRVGRDYEKAAICGQKYRTRAGTGTSFGATEIARTDITRPDNAAPDSRGGHRETGQRETIIAMVDIARLLAVVGDAAVL